MNTLRDALTAVERELASAEPQLATLTKRVAALRQTQAGLRSVLELEPDAPSARAQTVGPAGIASLESVGTPSPDQRPTTIEGVRAILQEKPDTPVRLDDVRAEFRNRDWIDPEWTRPNAAIYAAVVRLSENDPHIVREGKRWWKFVTNPPPKTTDDTVVGDMNVLTEVSTS